MVNLGSGLDTRPYRLELSPSVLWIEVDYPDLIQYKNTRLDNEKPHCKLKRIPADLSVEQERADLFNYLH